MLKVFAGYFRAPLSDELYGLFFPILLSVCAIYPGLMKWPKERYHEMYQLGSKMIRILNQHYGRELNSKAALSKGSLLFAQLLLLLNLERKEEAKSVWQALRSVKYELFRQLRQGLQISSDGDGHHKSQKPSMKESRSLTQENDEAEMKRDETDDLSLNSGVGIVYTIFGAMVDVFLEHEVDFFLMNRSDTSKKNEKRPENDEHLREILSQYVKQFNRDELEEVSRTSSHNLQPTIRGKHDEYFEFLNLLEHASNSGDWIQAFELHRKMFFDAIYGFLYDEANEHIQALRGICQNLSNATSNVDILSELEGIAQEKKSQYMLMCSLFPSEAGGRQDSLEIAKKIRHFFAEKTPEQFSLAEKHCDELEKDEGIGGYPTQISRELVVKLTRKHGNKMQDPKWAMNVNATMEGFARSISEAYDAIKATEFDSCLEKLDHISELMENEQFLHDLVHGQPEQSLALKGIRDACEHGSSFLKDSAEWHSAITEGDFDTAWSYMEHFSEDPLIRNWLDADDLTRRFAITENAHLQHLMLDLQDAHSAKDLERFSKIYAEVVKRWEDGGFPSIDQGKMRSFRSDNLEWMAEQAIYSKLWEDGLRFCDDYLIASAWELREKPRAHDDFLRMREQCKYGIIKQALNRAEANFDFEKCLQLIHDWEKLWQIQEQTAERPRSSFIFISQKLLQFLRDCHRDRCVPCARWARLRENNECTFDIQRQDQKRRRGNVAGRSVRNHNRSALRAPFGCSHHCQGGYCFFD